MNTRWLSSSGLVLAAALFLAVNIIASGTLTSLRLDLTENRLYTLSQGTRNILADLPEPVTLRFYFSAKTFSDIPQLSTYGRRVRDMLEEFEAQADGRIRLSIVDPEPFSEAEDQAVAFGMQPVPVGQSGEMGYFGLFGTNTTDDEEIIPFFQPGQEQSLEYDLSALVASLADPRKRVVGILGNLPVFGSEPTGLGGGGAGAWAFVGLLRESYETRQVPTDSTAIEPDIETLVVVHPKDLGERTLYAIDQFVLRGGKAMVFVDPLSEQDPVQPDPASPLLMPKRDSDLARLFTRWGLRLVPKKVVSEIDSAIRIQYTGSRGPQEVEYAPWLSLDASHLNQEDFITNELTLINVGTAGVLEPLPDATTRMRPLVFTGEDAMLYERDAIMFQRDPARLLEIYEPEGVSRILAARITGPAETAFPEGRPKSESDMGEDADYVAQGDINVIVFADTDMLADRFWLRYTNYLGQRVPQPVSDNANFLVNALDNLSGNDDLISLRSRAEYARPFTRVEDIRKQAESRFREQERQLQQKLEDTEQKIAELQQSRGDGQMLLSPEQREEIESFRAEQLRTRKALRAVQRDLKRDIEQLGTQLKFANIGLIPLVVAALAVLLGLWRLRRPVKR